MQIPIFYPKQIHIDSENHVGHQEDRYFSSERSFPRFVIFDTGIARFDGGEARFEVLHKNKLKILQYFSVGIYTKFLVDFLMET